MIDLTKQLQANFLVTWEGMVDWLVANVGRLKLEKCNVLQGEGWMIIRKFSHITYECVYQLYFDEPSYEVMFKLTWS